MICKFDMQTQMASVLGFLHAPAWLLFLALRVSSNPSSHDSHQANMGRQGDKKAFAGHDHGQPVEGTDGNEPMSEKQWRDMPKGSRPKTKPSEQHEEPEKETQKATGDC